MEWSPYQEAIFRAISDTPGSYIVEATAGSGKTTTIVEAIRHVPSERSVAFLAFNKAIADELKRRIQSPNAKCMTLHAAGLNAWRSHLYWDAAGLVVDGKKTRRIMDEMELGYEESRKFGTQLTKLVSIAKGAGIVPEAKDCPKEFHGLIPDSVDVWEELIDFYNLDPDEINMDLTRAVLARSIGMSREVVDFDDMLYMPVIAGAKFEKFDCVFLDEAQDVNGIQVEIVARMCNPPMHYDTRTVDSRVIAVGDPNQAIYGFRGALSDSMEQIAKRFDCASLPLSVSYRCPRAVVNHAKMFVRHIESHDDAVEGLVESPAEWAPKDFRFDDAILCRVAFPLIETAFLLIRAGVGCRVIGRDIGQGLVKLVQKMKATNLEQLSERLREYGLREVKRAKGNTQKIAQIEDRLDTLEVFIEECGPGTTVQGLIAKIESLFGEAGDGSRLLTLSTVHKAKGLEWDRVFILDAHEHMPSSWAKQPWERQQEVNLQYVAVTRARRELRYLSSKVLRVGAARGEEKAQVASGK